MKHKKLFCLGLILILFIFNMLLIPSILFLFKVSILKYNIIFSLVLTIISYLLIMKKEKYTLKEMIIYILTFLLVIIISIFISGKIYDTTYDSNTYHKTAVGSLKNGWNPVYETITEFNTSKKNDLKLTNTYELWNDHYAKGYWIFASQVYSFTDNIETGKSIYIITITATLLICYACLKTKFKWLLSFILSALISFNPVTLCQFGSFYNDGLLGNFLILMILSLTLILREKQIIEKKYSSLLYFLTLVILINIKFTGLAYGGVFSCFYYIYMLFNKDMRKENLKRITAIGIISLIIGVLLIGFSTYPKNIKTNSHPFYPLYGKNKVDIMTGNTPSGLANMNRFKRFFIANFSETKNTMEKETKYYKLKIPFTFKIEELKYFTGPDARIGGFGVLFSGILLIAICLFIYDLIKLKKEKSKIGLYIIPILATTFLIVILKDAWWARYIPIFYLIPIISLIAFINTKINEKKKKIITIIVLLTLILNSCLIAGPAMLNLIYQRNEVKTSLDALNIKDSSLLIVEQTQFSGAIFNIYDKHKNIVIVSNLEDKEKYTKYELMGSRINVVGYVKND